jgi:putative transcriptional regulator
MQSLRDHFLLAMPHLDDDNFSGSLSYLCDHDEKGTLGVIVNKPIKLTMRGLFEQLEIAADSCECLEDVVYYGGPVHKDRGFILHRGQAAEWDSSLQVTGELALTTSLDILKAIADNKGPEDFMVCLGCAGWEPDQLTNELKENSWLIVEGDSGILLDADSESRLDAAARKLGVNMSLMSREIGHG